LMITARLVDGRIISVPLARSWRLAAATPEQRTNYQIIGDGQGVHWPDIDEDIKRRRRRPPSTALSRRRGATAGLHCLAEAPAMDNAQVDPFTTAAEMLAALRTKHVSAVELLELHVRRITRHNPALNAIVEPDFERAKAQAQAADAQRARGDDAPLLGLPMTLKESINVRGLRTTAGMEHWKEFRSEHDAPVTTRVKAAGAVVMAKTNVPQMLADWQSANPVYGRTNNPWDVTRTPGGSTGGGAAALAAGLTPLEFGSDIGGSIRVPAAFCGVYGHRPSETAMPRSGQFPMPPMPNAAVVMGVQGPMARSAADLELALDVAAGAEAGEDVAWRLTLPPARRDRLGDFRVAVLPSLDWMPVDGEVAAAVDAVASRLSGLGAKVQVTQPEILGDHREHYALY